jgi:hypothetical protein
VEGTACSSGLTGRRKFVGARVFSGGILQAPRLLRGGLPSQQMPVPACLVAQNLETATGAGVTLGGAASVRLQIIAGVAVLRVSSRVVCRKVAEPQGKSLPQVTSLLELNETGTATYTELN